jgi:hypothetical protein
VLAQSAGDNQYQDPLPDDPAGGGGGGSQPSQSTPSAPSAPAAPSAPSASPSQSGEAAAAPSGAQLPRTGGDALLLAVLGGATLLGGVAIRRTLPHRD